MPAAALDNWNVLAGLFLVGVALVYVFYSAGGYLFVNRGLAALDSSYRFLPAGDGYPVTETAHLAVFGALYGTGFAVLGLAYLIYDGLDSLDSLEADEYAIPGGTEGDPADVDISELDEEGVWAAPAMAFTRLEEEEALALASEAMDEGDPDRAEAILDRFDDVNPPGGDVSPSEFEDGPEAGDDAGGAAAEAAPADAGAAAEDDEDAGILARRSAGVLDAFSEDDVNEDDVGGYAYDIAFIADSLTSKSFRLVGLFMTVMAEIGRAHV